MWSSLIERKICEKDLPFSHPFRQIDALRYRKMFLWRNIEFNRCSRIFSSELYHGCRRATVQAKRISSNFHRIKVRFGSSKMDSPQFFRYKRDCGWWDLAIFLCEYFFARSNNWCDRRFCQIFHSLESYHA